MYDVVHILSQLAFFSKRPAMEKKFYSPDDDVEIMVTLIQKLLPRRPVLASFQQPMDEIEQEADHCIGASYWLVDE